MKPKLLAALIVWCALVTAGKAAAQFQYKLMAFQEPYQPLTNAALLNGTTIWDDQNYKIPLAFPFKLNGTSITHFSLSLMSLVSYDTISPFSGFEFLSTDLHDRANASGANTSESPIRFAIDGSVGSRIFKAEIANAGFYAENNLYGTNEDSVNIQLWLYEGSDVVELRYGPSHISHPQDYFLTGGQPAIGFVRNLSLPSGNRDITYYLSGNPDNPDLDSAVNPLMITPITAYPAAGTVYRFSPKTTSVARSTALEACAVFPTSCSNELFISTEGVQKIAYEVIAADGTLTGLKGRVSAHREQIDVSGLAAGVYGLRLLDGQQTKTFKFIKL